MNEHISYQGKPATRGATPVQFFEATGGLPPANTKAMPRPADRPRELPPAESPEDGFQLFESDRPSGTEETRRQN